MRSRSRSILLGALLPALVLPAVLLVGFTLAPTSAAFAQDGDIPPAEDAANESDLPPPVLPRYDEETIVDHFHATEGSVDEEGRVHLVYRFSTKDSTLLEDWTPELKDSKRRIRWSQGYEGTWTTVEHGLVIADEGIFLHKAQWQPDVEISVEYLSMASSGKKDVLAAIYAWDRGRKIVGGHYGTHCLRLDGKMRPRGRPIPARALSPQAVEDRRTFGLRIAEGIAHALNNGHVTATSEENEKFTKDIEPGMIGLGWKGRVNGFIFTIEIEGKLDPEYLEEHLPGAVTMPPTEKTTTKETAKRD